MHMISDDACKVHASMGWKNLANATPLRPPVNEDVMQSAIWRLQYANGKYSYQHVT